MKDVTFLNITSNKLSEEISRTKMTVTGQEKLVHEICRVLCTTVGTSSFNTEYGSGLSSLPQYTFYDDAEAKTIISSLIKSAETCVLKSQAGKGLPAAETLDSLKVGSVVVNEGDVTIVVYVTSLAGKSTATTMVL
jgi:hypothetical protein